MKRATTLSVLIISAMVVVAAMAGILMRSCQLSTIYNYDGGYIGYALLRGEFPANVTHVGSSTREAISALSATETHIYIKTGDEPSPIGDGKANFRIIFRANNEDVLGIRLKSGPDRTYDILGYWTPQRHQPMPYP